MSNLQMNLIHHLAKLSDLVNQIPVGSIDRNNDDLRIELIKELHYTAGAYGVEKIVRWNDNNEPDTNQIAIPFNDLMTIAENSVNIATSLKQISDTTKVNIFSPRGTTNN